MRSRWTGDPRGHWEGNTLVVETTNYHDRGWLSTHAGSGRLRGTPNSTALHIVERFTMIDQNTIQYEMTVDDPQTFTQPWTRVAPAEPQRRVPASTSTRATRATPRLSSCCAAPVPKKKPTI